jgi:ribose 5-phosphate isomerase A
MTKKERAADAALSYVENGMTVGLGSGSTSECFIRALAGALAAGRFRDLRGIPTSIPSQRLAEQLGIPLVPLMISRQIDLAIDGADEVDPALNLIKGLGGALLREKITEQNARRFLVIVDAGKLVPQLGSRGPVPVEILPFACEAQVDFIRQMGGRPQQRLASDGKPYITDNGNPIYDCFFGPIADPAALDLRLRSRAGVVETGLFIGMAERVIVGYDDHTEERMKKQATAK